MKNSKIENCNLISLNEVEMEKILAGDIWDDIYAYIISIIGEPEADSQVSSTITYH